MSKISKPEQGMIQAQDAYGKLTNIPTISQRASEANLPIQVQMDELAAEPCVIFISYEEAHAMLPGSDKVTEGLQVVWKRPDYEQLYGTFIGAVVLVRTLKTVDLPFAAKLQMNGRTWTFVDPTLQTVFEEA